MDIGGKYFCGDRSKTSLGVAFLCQTVEGRIPNPYRRVVLEKGTSVFMPIINWLSIQFEDGLSDQELITKANEKMQAITDLHVSIDGMILESSYQTRRATW